MRDTLYIPRSADLRLAQLFGQFPALRIVGPRASGKSRTAERLVPAGKVVDLTESGVARQFQADPGAALRLLGEPLVIDEWSEAPGVLGAVKRAVDQGGGVGRFVLTGSANDELHVRRWQATGRCDQRRIGSTPGWDRCPGV
jgi:predicted AAA+ superfamily ATPase